MNCASCQHFNEASANFCEECGAPLARGCAGCGAALKASAKFCPQCGRPATAAERGLEKVGGDTTLPGSALLERDPSTYTPKHLADKILSSRSAIEGERKRVTVLFSDIQGSMELSEQLDAEQWHSMMDRFFQIMTEGVHRFEGSVNQYTGDGVMALFGAPIAHEDHAQRACFAALHLQSELRKYANELRIEHGLSINVRIGIHSGEVVVGKIGDDLRMEYTAQGHTVGLAARMQQIAEPGKAYLTGSTEELVRGYFALESLGHSRVKGVAEPVAVFALGGLGEMRTRLDVSRGRGFSKFVGRSDELDALEKAFSEVSSGDGRVVGLVAEAGTGKSRLCFEFAARCRERGVNVYETYCLPHGRTLPLFPILQLYRGVFDITDNDSPERARDKIAGRIVLIDEQLLDTLPFLFDFLGVPDPQRPVAATDPELRTRRILEVLRRIIAARGDRAPAVVLVEDLHWLDPGSGVFLDSLVESIPSGRLLLLLNFRPEYAGKWMQKSYYRQISLAPLGAAAIDELLDHLLGRDTTLGVLRRRVREQTGGNPFFVEEIVRELAEQGHIAGERGSYRLETPVESIPVPGSVQGVLAARIDRLAEDSKEALQAASAIGRNFSLTLLAAATGRTPNDLEALLSTLVDDEFVFATSLYPDPEYAFKHALTRDVAYDSLLGARKRELHAAIGRALEHAGQSGLGERAALVADHYERAGENLAAALWHERAALWVGVSNLAESYEHWRKVRTLTESVEATPAVRTQRVRACCQELTRGQRAGADVDPAFLLAEARRALPGCDDPHAETRVLTTEGSIRYFAGDWGSAFPILDRALANARASGDDRLVSESMTYWQVVQSLRDPAVACAMLDEIGDVGIAGASDLMGFQVHGWSRIFPAISRTLLGDYSEGMARAEAALEASRAGDDRVDLTMTLGLVGSCLLLWGQGRRARVHLREARRLGEATGVLAAISIAAMSAATTSSIARSALTTDELASSIGRMEQLGWGFQRPSLGLLRAMLQFAREDPSAALETLRDTRALSDGAGMDATVIVTHIGEAEILIALNGGDARADVSRTLAEAGKRIERRGLRIYLPRLHVVRAALETAAGDHAAAERERSLAIGLYEEMGAPLPDDLADTSAQRSVGS